uniref:Beta-defensin-like domain-containing protein n=1 Tax=Pavo cristatus TaxID=9049 RepID=A0A8C9FX65_PAVCR
LRNVHPLLLTCTVNYFFFSHCAGQPYFSSRIHACRYRKGVCVPGICRPPYHWAGSCGSVRSCCVRGRWA